MPYRISKDYESTQHALTEEAYYDAARIQRLSRDDWRMEFAWRAKAMCGRTITGGMGYSAYNAAITCGNCQRSMNEH